MKRFLVVAPTPDGGITSHPMKAWLRAHPESVPAGLDATLSTSHKLRDGLKRTGWVVKELDGEVRLIRPADADMVDAIATVLGNGEVDVDDDRERDAREAEPFFALEHQLRDFLAQNIATVPVGGRRLQLYVDPTGRDGIEYSTDVGFIDILAVDENGDFVVFELKRARTADRAIGQLTRYMGWLKHTIARERKVSGVIVAREIDQRLRFAASVIPEVVLLEYKVEFTLRAAHDLPVSARATAV